MAKNDTNRQRAKGLSEEIIVTHLEHIRELQTTGEEISPAQATYPINVLKALALRDGIDEQKPVNLGDIAGEKIRAALRASG